MKLSPKSQFLGRRFADLRQDLGMIDRPRHFTYNINDITIIISVFPIYCRYTDCKEIDSQQI